MANSIDAIFQVGKGGINENMIKQLDDALEARELVKIRLLPNSGMEVREVCRELAQELGAEEVQVIGTKFVLYRKSKKNPRIELPSC
jgi:RNA-binding protein